MLKILSGISFFIAMLCASLLLFEISVPFVPRPYLAYAVIGLGVFGIILNLIGVQQSKHNVAYSVVYWTSCLILVAGIGMRMLHLPFSMIVLIVGFSGLFISMLLPKTRTDEKDNKELLDDSL